MRDLNLGFCLLPTATHRQCAFIQTDINNNRRHRVLIIMLATLFYHFQDIFPKTKMIAAVISITIITMYILFQIFKHFSVL